jgi:hypothetical protein
LILVGDPATGYSYKATLSAMVNFVGGNIQFSSLGGISLTNPTNGQVLTFNGTNWVNQTPAAAPVSSVFGRTGAVVAAEGDYSLTQLSDVTISTPTSGQVLKYNGTAWVNDSDTDTGITSLNGLTANTQTFATGTSGTDFNISSTTSAHTFNLPTASATNRGALSSSDWTTFNAKQNTITLTTTGNSGSATFISDTLNIPTYTLAGLGGISLTSLSASSPLSYNNTTGAFTIQVSTTSQDGYLSSTDWNTFNSKQSTITLTTTGSSGASTFISNTLNIPTYTLAGLGGVSGSGTTNYVPKWTGSTALGNSQIFDNGTSVGINTASPSASYRLDVNGAARVVGTAFFNANIGGNAWNYDSGNVRWVFGSATNQLSRYFTLINIWSTTAATLAIRNIASQTANSLQIENSGGTVQSAFFSDGSLGIKTNVNAGYALDVTGTFRSTLDARINELTVGKGGGSIATNTAVGVEAINATATGATNTAVGYRALFSLTSGAGNTSIGNQSGRLITTGTRNTGVGYFSLFNLAGGSRNVALGYESLNGTTSGNYNNAIGDGAGYDVTTAEFNTIIGYNTGRGITTGSNNTIIGGQVSGLSSSLANTIILADGQGNQRLYINNSGNVGIGTTSPTAKIEAIRTSANDVYLSGNSYAIYGYYQPSSLSNTNYNGGVSGWLRALNLGAIGGYSTAGVYGRLTIQASQYSYTTNHVWSGVISDVVISGTTATANRLSGLQSNLTVTTGCTVTDFRHVYLQSQPITGTVTNHWGIYQEAGTKNYFSGNTLIGTTTDAGYKLDVNGTARVSGMTTIATSTANTESLVITNSATGGSPYLKLGVWATLGQTFSSQYTIIGNNCYPTNGASSTWTRINAARNASFININYDEIVFGSSINAASGSLETGGMYLVSNSLGIGIATPNASALLDVSSTTKGFLPPRMTTTQKNAISSPAAGLVVYDTTLNKLCVYTTAWETVTSL